MKNEEIVKWLRAMKVETGSLLCLGCGYEHHCGIHGCAVMLAAADAMENLQTENASLRRNVGNLTDAQAVMVKEFNKKLEELHEAKSELDAAVSGQETLQKELAKCKAERDAAVEDIRKMIICEFWSVCEFCVHDENQNAGCIKENGFGAWCCKNAAWRGPQKEA